MDFNKAFLYSMLAVVIFFLWTAWIKEHPANVVSPAPTSTIAASSQLFPSLPTKTAAALEKSEANSLTANLATHPQRFVKITSDVLELTIDTQGGNIVNANLLRYSQQSNNREPIGLLSDRAKTLSLAQSGLIGKEGPDSTSHQAQYQAEKKNYVLDAGQNELTARLTWRSPTGIHIEKRFTLSRGKYLVNVEYVIQNKSAAEWQGNLYTQLVRRKIEEEKSGLFSVSSYQEAAISTSNKPYEKITYKQMNRSPLDREEKGGWIAMQQHYFLSAWIPTTPKNEINRIYSSVNDGDVYTLGIVGPTLVVKPNTSATTNAKLYLGPKIVEYLEAAAPHLKLTIDYGWLWFISSIIFWLMKFIYQVVGNWGWSIVLVTVLIKLLFYKLSATSYRSMANMRNLQPQMEMLKQRYGDDRQKLNQAVIELYRKEKINPLGGCLPIVIQIPVFIALYWVLIESVQLRQAPFIFWIHDLSAKDPFYVLPILMGLTMLIQQRLSPPPPDPMQAKVMLALPVVFTALFLYFPAGLVLYWVVNNSLSILQQWYITQKLASKPITQRDRRNKSKTLTQ